MVGVPAAFKKRLGRAAGQYLGAVAAHQPPLAVPAHRIVIGVSVGAAVGAGVAAASAVPAGCGVPAVSAVPGRGAAVDGTADEETAPAAQPVKKSIDKTGNKDLFTVTHRPSFL